MSSVAVGIRIHRKEINKTDESTHHPVNLNPLVECVQRTLACPQITFVFVAFDGQDDNLEKAILSNEILNKSSKVKFIRIPIWGTFVPALNGILSASIDRNLDYLMFVSVEVALSSFIVESLISHFDNDTLVVGARLVGHQFHPEESSVKLSGLTSPWNTLCMWSLSKLSLTGFLYVSDLAPHAGVEEVVVIVLLQKLLGESSAKAKLVDLAGSVGSSRPLWKVDWHDTERQKWHDKKMQTKYTRAEAQLKMLFLDWFEAKVVHLSS